MAHCQNCGQVNSQASNFCRFCGTKFSMPPPPANNFGHPNQNAPLPYPQASQPVNYEEQPPRPYSWKTDEFQLPEDQNKTKQIDRVQPLASFQPPQHAPLQHYQQQGMTANYQCPRCASRLYPRTVRQISTAGWIVFAILLVTIFPLFWIGLLIKEDVRYCPICNLKLP